MKKRLAALALVCVPAPAAAQTGLDAVENIFGATNIHAVTGHGGLTVGVSNAGDVTVLTWPNPSFTDQLGYATTNALDARQRPRFGAPEGAGLFLGLVFELTTGERRVTWLRDDHVWTRTQTYNTEDGPNPLTTYTAAELHLTVTVEDAVDPKRDVFVRDVSVQRDVGSPVQSVWLLTYANLSPTPPNHKVPELPIADWAFDGRDDFGAFWSPAEEAVVHFHPADRNVRSRLTDLLATPPTDWGVLGEALKADDPAAFLAANGGAAEYGEGTWLALTTQPAPDQHHIGGDTTDFCTLVDDFIDNIIALPERLPGLTLPVDPNILGSLRCPDEPPLAEREGWTHLPPDAYLDASDGELSNGEVAAGEINEALRTPLPFDAEGKARGQVVLTAAAGEHSALALLEGLDAAAIPARAAEAARVWLTPLNRPNSADPKVNRVATRALVNLRAGLVRENGAIVASIARQPSYGLDWPRDGCFFNIALDVAGLPAEAARRTDFYVATQRQEPVRPTPLIDPPPPPDPDDPGTPFYPAGAWEMNMYADGTPGGTWRFEIDNTAFALFAIVAHAGWSDTPDTHLRDRWASIELAADLLARWRDPETGLHAPAQEDDNAAYTQTLHGAVTVQGALELAARAAHFIGEAEDARRWRDRAAEVRQAILTHLHNPDTHRFINDPAGGEGTINPGSAATGPTAWLVWPMKLLPWDDARVEAQLLADLEAVAPIIQLETPGGGYVLKNLLSLAIARGGDPVIRPRLESLLSQLAAQATEGTDHFGEVFVRTGDEATGYRADQRVSTPHLWEGILFYLTAYALEHPEAMSAWEQVLPPFEELPGPDAGPPDAASVPDSDLIVSDAGPPPPSPDFGVRADAGPDSAISPSAEAKGSDACDCRVGASAEKTPAALPLLLLSALGLSRRRLRARARR